MVTQSYQQLGRFSSLIPENFRYRETSPSVSFRKIAKSQVRSGKTGSSAHAHRFLCIWRVYPRQLTENGTVPDAAQLLRKTLVSQPDSSVVIIQIGYSTNLARLLKSPPDTISALDGHQLISRKVRLLSIMAGNFHARVEDGVTVLEKGAPEPNLISDVPAAQTLFKQWPTRIVVSGNEIGAALPYPVKSIERDYTYVKNHPIADTYRTYCKELKMEEHGVCVDNHLTFDLTSVLYAVRPDGNYGSVEN